MCPECDHHFYVSSQTRISQLLDEDSFEEWFADLAPADPLEFADKKPYKERLKAEQAKTGLREACVVGRGYMRGRPLVFGTTDSAFIMGSMGSVVGEKLTRAIENATKRKLPLIIVSGSGGGARMHEGILSLMQMGKVSAALARFHEGGGLFISVLTNPTMGGVAASFASLGDIIIAEPKALVGFAGPRVVAGHGENRIAARLPDQRVPACPRICRSHRPPGQSAQRIGPDHRLLRAIEMAEIAERRRAGVRRFLVESVRQSRVTAALPVAV